MQIENLSKNKISRGDMRILKSQSCACVVKFRSNVEQSRKGVNLLN